MKICPSKIISNHELSSSFCQFLFKLGQSCSYCSLCPLFKFFFLIGCKIGIIIGSDDVLDNIHNLIHLCHLQTISPSYTHLSSKEPADGHGLTKSLSIPSQTRKLTPRHCWLHCLPVVHVIPGRSYSVICVLVSSVGQQKPCCFTLHFQVKVGKFNFVSH